MNEELILMYRAIGEYIRELSENAEYDDAFVQKLADFFVTNYKEVLWKAYQKNYYYAANISWQMVMQSIRFLYKYLITITKGL